MNVKELMNLLRKLHACDEARRWAGGKDLQAAWDSCNRADWMLWLCGRMADQPGWPARKQIVLVACACAETALQYVRPGEDRPRLALEAARAWVRGEVSIEDVRRATYDAAAAAYAYAADAAAYAAYADAADAAAYAADAAAAAAYAADAAAAAAYAAAAAAANKRDDASSARAKALTELAHVVRREIPVPFAAPAEIGGAA